LTINLYVQITDTEEEEEEEEEEVLTLLLPHMAMVTAMVGIVPTPYLLLTDTMI